MKLQYKRNAKDENEATMLGNGHVGMWVYRNRKSEKIHLNEGTFWTGKPMDYSLEEYPKRILKVREILKNGNPNKANRELEMIGKRYNTEDYQPVCDLLFSAEREEGKECLDLSTGILTAHGTTYFVSYPHSCFVVHIELEKKTSLKVALQSVRNEKCRFEQGKLYLTGNAPAKKGKGMAFCVAIAGDVPLSEDMSVRSLTLFGNIQTGFIAWDKNPETDWTACKDRATAIVEKAKAEGYEKILKSHISDYQSLFSQGELVFGMRQETICIEEELRKAKDKPSPQLMTAYFEFAKFLTISCSRETSQASYLQGIWNKDVKPAWHNNCTININTEMNYWFPDCANMGTLTKPLLPFIDKIDKSGRVTAKKIGFEGSCAFHNVDIWGFTVPTLGFANWGFFPFAGAWMTMTLFDHYRYTQDKEYLATIYPYLKGCSDFALSYVTEWKGQYITAPSTSPENKRKVKWWKLPCAVSIATTCDMFILRELFDEIIECSEVLCVDKEYAEKCRKVKEKLFKPTLLPDGRLKEFAENQIETERGHRHFSHLIGAFPFEQVKVFRPSEYTEAVRKSLLYRLQHGSGYTGWSCAWALNLLEKFHEKETFETYLQKLFVDSTYPNMTDRHPPFQIDGNFGAGRAMSGLIAITEDDIIELFPIKIEQNKSGIVKNLCLKGGYKISMCWENHSPTTISVYSETSKTISFRNRDDGSVKTFALLPKQETVLSL